MKINIALDLDLFTANVSQDGEIGTSKDVRQLLALANQTFPQFLRELGEVHKQLLDKEQGTDEEATEEVAAEAPAPASAPEPQEVVAELV